VAVTARRSSKIADGWQVLDKSDLSAAKNVAGIYEFTTSTGKKYIGQSKDIAKRLAQHGGRVADGGQILFKKIDVDIPGLDAKTVREIAEQVQIEKFLGRRVEKGFTTDRLENLVNPIGKARLEMYNKYKDLFG